QSANLGREQDRLGLGPLALESLRIQVANLADDHVHRPMVPVVRELISLRDEIFRQLERPHPGQARELYLLAGVACAVLGHASGNLGFLSAAHDQAQTAVICADRAGYPPLAAWAYGVRALQCEWNGRPREALGLVARALKAIDAGPHRGPNTAWLAAIEARHGPGWGTGTRPGSRWPPPPRPPSAFPTTATTSRASVASSPSRRPSTATTPRW